MHSFYKHSLQLLNVNGLNSPSKRRVTNVMLRVKHLKHYQRTLLSLLLFSILLEATSSAEAKNKYS